MSPANVTLQEQIEEIIRDAVYKYDGWPRRVAERAAAAILPLVLEAIDTEYESWKESSRSLSGPMMARHFRDYLVHRLTALFSASPSPEPEVKAADIDRNIPEDECSTADMLRKVARLLQDGRLKARSDVDAAEWIEGLNHRATLLDSSADIAAGRVHDIGEVVAEFEQSAPLVDAEREAGGFESVEEKQAWDAASDEVWQTTAKTVYTAPLRPCDLEGLSDKPLRRPDDALRAQLAALAAKLAEAERRLGEYANELEAERNDGDLLRKQFAEAKAEAAEAKRETEAAKALAEHYRFAPLGDNHHNALLCPYCSPAAQKLIAERDSIRQQVGEWEKRWDALFAKAEQDYPYSSDPFAQGFNTALRVIRSEMKAPTPAAAAERPATVQQPEGE